MFVSKVHQLCNNFVKCADIIRKCNQESIIQEHVKGACINASNTFTGINVTEHGKRQNVDFDILDSNKTQTLTYFDNSEFSNNTHRPSG